jgi:hypothetical protein
MSGLIQSTSTEFFRGKYFCIYFFYNAANTARTGYIQFNAGAASRISVEIVQPLAFAVNGGDRLTLNTDGTSTFHLVLRLQLLRSIGYEIENSCR